MWPGLPPSFFCSISISPRECSERVLSPSLLHWPRRRGNHGEGRTPMAAGLAGGGNGYTGRTREESRCVGSHPRYEMKVVVRL